MKTDNYKNIGLDKIKGIFEQGLRQIEFIETVFREWVKLNQSILNNEYSIQKGISRQEDDLDIFSLWLVDNIQLQVYCKGSDNIIVKEFCIEHFGYEDGLLLEN